MATILDEIIHFKKAELLESKALISLREIEKQALATDARPSFQKALENPDFKSIKLIAEVKKASPSKGIIDPNFNSLKTAEIYALGGVHCMSVLTEKKYFQGSPEYLKEIKSTFPQIPLLRKDFIVEEYQILEAKAWGASAILLIVDCLDLKSLTRLREFAESLDLDVLVETHREDEVRMALDAGSTIIGVNNRNLRTFATDLNTTFSLRKIIPEDKIMISESGISNIAQVKEILAAGIQGILVGESLMKQKESFLKQIISQ